MKKTKEDAVREERIDYEIVVDAYDEYERVAGWHCHLDDKMSFPFEATAVKELKVSPLKKGETVTVLSMADQDDCEGGMLVQVRWNDREFAVPLEQIRPMSVENEFDEDTLEAIEDWCYWVDMGYCF
jgi:hypothetical protein